MTLGWRDRAACLGKTHLEWDGPLTPELFRICMTCPVRDECLIEALDHEERSDAGVWGGTGPEERRPIRKGADPYEVWRQSAKEFGWT